jgi:hypothetical protein
LALPKSHLILALPKSHLILTLPKRSSSTQLSTTQIAPQT